LRDKSLALSPAVAVCIREPRGARRGGDDLATNGRRGSGIRRRRRGKSRGAPEATTRPRGARDDDEGDGGDDGERDGGDASEGDGENESDGDGENDTDNGDAASRRPKKKRGGE